jgi:hypothetical protein
MVMMMAVVPVMVKVPAGAFGGLRSFGRGECAGHGYRGDDCYQSE